MNAYDIDDDAIEALLAKKDASKTVAKFYEEVDVDLERSEKMGRKCYKMTPYISIKARGVKDFMSYRVTEEHIARFPVEWKRFKALRETMEMNQTPIKVLPLVDPAVWQELYEINKEYRFVENLAQAEPVAGLEDVFEQAKIYMRLKNESDT